MKQRKAILYIRVSTDEQADKGYSLKHQEERLRSYCQFEGINVVGLYKDDHSAKTFERPAFRQMLALLKKNKKSADLLLFTKWDRFSRNAADAYAMINTLNSSGVEPQAIEQPLDLNIPENKIMLAFYLAAPEVENDRRALNVTVGMRRAKKEGRWMATAPKGYVNVINEQKKKVIAPSPDAKYIKWVFEEINKGILHADQVRKLANKNGFKISRAYFWSMIRNPVYCGKIYIPAHKDEDACFVRGIHEPLINEELFYNVQDILSGRKKNIQSRGQQKEELALRGFLVCKRCGGNLTGNASKGMGGKYFYYHCQPGCPERIKADVANNEAIKELQKISAKKEAINLYRLILEKELKKSSKESTEDKEKIGAEIKKNQERIDNAQQLMLDDELPLSEYKSIKSRYEEVIRRLQEQIADSSPKISDYKKYLDFGFNLLEKVDEFYCSAKPAIKLQTLSSMYAEKFVFENNSYRTPIYREELALILSTGADSSPNKKGQNQKSLTLSSQVVPTGIEPVSKV
jgi:site-specific DNA recombinase